MVWVEPWLPAYEGVFTTGPTGRQANWPSFEEALVALQRSPEPVWRRSTLRGLRTQARGVRWDRTTRAALDKMAAEAAGSIWLPRDQQQEAPP